MFNANYARRVSKAIRLQQQPGISGRAFNQENTVLVISKGFYGSVKFMLAEQNTVNKCPLPKVFSTKVPVFHQISHNVHYDITASGHALCLLRSKPRMAVVLFTD